MHIGPCCSVKCDNIVLTSGQSLQWVDQLRYLGVFIVRFVKFQCSLDHAKRNFCHSFNSIFGKVGRAASGEVVLHLIKTKCLPVLLYGLEVCSLTKAHQRSLEFAVIRFLMKLFCTSNMVIINHVQVTLPLDFQVSCCSKGMRNTQ